MAGVDDGKKDAAYLRRLRVQKARATAPSKVNYASPWFGKA
jgi:hypothetical protein